jgi:hypothetical protein
MLSSVLGRFVMSDISELDPATFIRKGAKLVYYLLNISERVNDYNAMAVQCSLFMSFCGVSKSTSN